MSRCCLICALVALPGLLGQNPDRPRFAKDHVLPYRSREPRLLTRGQFVSIYGGNLTPRQWCEEQHVQPEPYPTELCGVRVLVGGYPAGLMYIGPIGTRYVSSDQINFQSPMDAPAEGMVPIQVCVGINCSDPVEVEFTAKDILLHLEGNAYVHMPVWIGVEMPMNFGFSYPFSVCPWDFRGYEFEIRREGKILEPAAKPECPLKGTGFRMGIVGQASKLPLHLVHQFDSPGIYEVRLSGRLTDDFSSVARMGHSDWIQVMVQPYSDSERDTWLRDMEAKASKPGRVYSADLIVSLLAWPDEKALGVLLKFLPPPPPPMGRGGRSFSGNYDQVMHCVAPNALAGFPEALRRKVIPAERQKPFPGCL